MSKCTFALCVTAGITIVGLVGCSPPTLLELAGGRDEVDRAFRGAHTSVYRVYDIGPERDALWEQLAAVFEGPALTREYVEHFTTLVRMGRDQTEVKVLSVDYEDVQILGSDDHSLEVAADWSVGGIVSHQRHSHHRVNRYQAVYTLAASDGDPHRLRIVESRLQNAERLRNPLGDATEFPLDDLPTSRRGLVGPAELLRSGLLDAEPEHEAEQAPAESGREQPPEDAAGETPQ
jgi:hypothetical protein